MGALVLTTAGCADGEDATQAAREELLRDLDSCEPESLPVRVRLHNSGISCAEAIAMRLIMTDISGTTDLGRFGGWSCKELPPSRRPVEIECRQGEKFFTFESD